MIRIERLDRLTYRDLKELLAASQKEGFRHMQRLYSDFAEGTNRFDRPGEELCVAKIEDRLVGVCGINLFTWQGEAAGRLRRLYVLPEYRRLGVGGALTEVILKNAAASFTAVLLRTHNPEAHRFYLRLGFQEVTGDPNMTHILYL